MKQEKLSSNHADGIGFSDLHFFVPEIVIELNDKEVKIYAADAETVYREIRSSATEIIEMVKTAAAVKNKLNRESYVDIIEKLKQHILRGDCYEINFCQEFFADNAMIDPLFIYNRLSALSPNPFSGCYKVNSRYCLCASPERYLKKEGQKVFSQPIKGTAKRNLTDDDLDESSKELSLAKQ